MCYFFCIACSDPKEPVRSFFGDPFNLVNAKDMPIGKAVVGGTSGRQAFLVTHNGCSCDLVNRKRRGKGFSDAFLTAISSACENSKSVSLLLHWFNGDVRTEAIPVSERTKANLTEFVAQFPALREDTRYIIVLGEKTEDGDKSHA